MKRDKIRLKTAAAAVMIAFSLILGAVMPAAVSYAKIPQPPMVTGLKVKQHSLGGLAVTYRRDKKLAGYRVQYATNPYFRHASRINTSSTRVHIPGKVGVTYYVRVLGFNYDSKRHRVIGKYCKAVKAKVRSKARKIK